MIAHCVYKPSVVTDSATVASVAADLQSDAVEYKDLQSAKPIAAVEYNGLHSVASDLQLLQ